MPYDSKFNFLASLACAFGASAEMANRDRPRKEAKKPKKDKVPPAK